MKNNKLDYWKKGFSILLSICIVQMSFDSTVLKVYAEEVAYSHAVEEYCEEYPLEGYLYLQEQESTGIMDAKVEAELNAQGIFDSEIKDFSEEDIKELENADSIYVSTQYIKYTYTGEKTEVKDNSISNSSTKNQKSQDKKKWKSDSFDVIENQDIVNEIFNADLFDENMPEDYEVENMSDEDIDALIKECYFDEESEKEDSIFDKILTGIGIKPQNVYAKSATDTQQSSYLKKALFVIQTGDKIMVCFNCFWLKEPSNRLNDLVGIQWTGGDRITKNSEYPYRAEISYIETASKIGSVKFGRVVQDYTKQFYENWTPFSAVVDFSVPKNYINSKGELVTYSDIRTHVSFYLNKTYHTSIDLRADYQHQKKTTKFNLVSATGCIATTATFIFAPMASAVGNGALLISSIAQGVDVIKTNTYYEACGGSPCNANFTYK